MATFIPQVLSASTNGRGIPITATSTAGTAIHTVGANEEQLWIYASNIHTAVVRLTMEMGGAAAGDQIIVDLQPYSGQYLVTAGWLCDAALSVAAFASVTAVVNIFGHSVERA